jgi:hypothetical protein
MMHRARIVKSRKSGRRALAASRKKQTIGQGIHMKAAFLVLFVTALIGTLAAQESKPVPKDSVRVAIPGCARGVVFTAGRPSEDRLGGAVVPEGMHLRMSGPKKTMAEIKGQEGSRIEITGLMKKGQPGQEGIGIGGVRIAPAPSPSGGTLRPGPGVSQNVIDVEGWRRVSGECPR